MLNTQLWTELAIKLGQIMAAIALVLFLVHLLRQYFSQQIEDADIRYRARKVVTLSGVLLVFLVLIAGFSSNLSNLTLALGAASAGIAFALQEVIASFAGWLALVLGGFYRVGDRVELGGIKGDVIDISILRTTLMEMGSWVDGDLYNGRIVRVANSFVFKEPVFNYSGEFPFLWDELTLPIHYGSDRALTRQLIEQVALEELSDYTQEAQKTWKQLVRSYRIEDARILPLVTMTANDNWLTFTLRYVVNHRHRRIVKDRLFTRLLDSIEASEGKVRLASTTIELVKPVG